MLDDPLLTRAEVSVRLKISPWTVKRLAARGLLSERRIGPRLIRITVKSVEDLERGGRQAGAVDE